MSKKYYRGNRNNKSVDAKDLSKILPPKDDIIDDFGELPKVTLEDDDEVFDLDYTCTDWGNAMEFFET